MDDFIDSFIGSSAWSHRNASSGASWSGTSLSPRNVLLAESVDQYGEVENPSISMMASNHIVGHITGEDLNIQGHDGTSSIFDDASLKYESLKELYSDERLSHQNVCSQPSNAITMNSDAQVRSFSLQGVDVSTTAAAPFDSALLHGALAMASSIESNSSQLSAFPQALGEAHSITSVPAIWPSLYSSVSSLMGHENLPDFGYQGNENKADMLRKISLGNGRFHLDRLSAASIPIKDKNQPHNLSSFSDEQWTNLIVGALQPQKLSPPSEGHIISHQINNSSCTQSQAVPANGAGCNGATKQRIRARRGQATDPHSIAERLRREKIAERMKNLQELVPNSNKTDKASMLDEIIDYVKFLQLQVKVLSMSRLGAAGAVVPLLTDSQAEGSGGLLLASSAGEGGSESSHSEEILAFELEVVKLMETNVTTAMQYLQNKGFCLMPVALATAISNQKGSSTAAIPPERRKPAGSPRLTPGNRGSAGINCNENEETMVKEEEAHHLNDKATESNGKAN